MKKLSLIALLVSLAFISKAQNEEHRPSMEEHLQKTKEMFQKELQLSQAQQSQVDEALKNFMVEAEKLHKQFPPPPPPPMDPAMKEALDKLEKARDEKMKNILTAEQFKKYLELKKNMHPPHPGGERQDHPKPEIKS